MNIYSIKNEKLNFFNRPIYCESENEALSYIQNILMSDADRALIGLKGDLSLYLLGSIDFVSGEIIPCVYYDYDHDGNNRGPVKICSLEDIFNSIPEDKLKPSLTRDDLVHVYEKIKKIEDSLNSHEHSNYLEKKGKNK